MPRHRIAHLLRGNYPEAGAALIPNTELKHERARVDGDTLGTKGGKRFRVGQTQRSGEGLPHGGEGYSASW